MSNKKGQGISMTYIIIAALALVVLVVIILWFTGGMGNIASRTKEVEELTEQQKSIWMAQCKMYCSLEKNMKGDCPSFCSHEFKKENQVFTCPDLGVDCSAGLVETSTAGDKGELSTTITTLDAEKEIKVPHCAC